MKLSLFRALILIASPFAVVTPQYETGVAPVRNFFADAYGGAPQNWDVIQHPTGRIIVANSNGVLIYDGVEWVTVRNTSGRLVRSLAVDSAGVIYVGMLGAFGRVLQDPIGRWQFESLSDSLPGPHNRLSDVWDTHTAGNRVFFRTDNHLYIRKPRSTIVLTPKNAFVKSALISGKLHVYDDRAGLFMVENDSLRFVLHDKRLDGDLYGMADFGNGKMVFGIGEFGLLVLQNGHIAELGHDAAILLHKKNPHDLIVLQSGHIAVATLLDGVWIFDSGGNAVSHFDLETGMSGSDAKCLFQDREGILWVGLNSGIARIAYPPSVRFFSQNQGLKATVDKLVRYRGQIYGASSSGIVRLQMSSHPWEVPSWQTVPGMNDVSLFLAEAGAELLAATGSGVYSVQDRLVRLTPASIRAACIQPVNDQVILVGLKEGLIFMSKRSGHWTVGERIEGIHEQVRTIARESDTVYWLGTRSRGAMRLILDEQDPFNVRAIKKFGTDDGLPSGGVRVSYVHGKVRLSCDKGLYTVVGERCLPDTSFGHELIDGSYAVDQIYPDQDGSSWIVAVNSQSQKDRVIHVTADDKGQFTCEWLTIVDLNRFPIYGIFGEKGTTWFSGPKGVAQVVAAVNKSRPSYQALIRRMTILGDSLVLAGEASLVPQLPYENRHVRIEFAAPSYENEDFHEYSYRLDGFDDKWSDWSVESQKDYTNIQEGAYVFYVRARDGAGVLSETAQLRFNVLPPWYRSWWAYAIYLIAGIVLTRVLYGWRVRALKTQNLSLEQHVEERTRRLADANREIEAQRDHLKQVNNQLEDTLKELKETQFQLVHSEKMASVGQMVAGLAHEVNNPLTFVLPNLDYVRTELGKLMGTNASGELKSLLDHIHTVIKIDELNDAIDSSIKGGNRIKEIVENLKSFTRVDRHIKSDGLIEDALDIAVDLFFGQFKDITWIRQYEFCQQIEADFQELNQALVNILTNAVQAVSQSINKGLIRGGEGQIALATNSYRAKGSHYVRVSIHDNGIGIAPEHVSRVFEPFFTSKPVGEGRGLGLSEAYAIVSRHGGHIEISGKPDHGTNVDVFIKVSAQ